MGIHFKWGNILNQDYDFKYKIRQFGDTFKMRKHFKWGYILNEDISVSSGFA